MKKFSAIYSLLILGTLGYLVKSWLSTGNLEFNLAEEDIHLYL